MSVDNFWVDNLVFSAIFRIFMGGVYIKKTQQAPLSVSEFDFIAIEREYLTHYSTTEW